MAPASGHRKTDSDSDSPGSSLTLFFTTTSSLLSSSSLGTHELKEYVWYTHEMCTHTSHCTDPTGPTHMLHTRRATHSPERAPTHRSQVTPHSPAHTGSPHTETPHTPCTHRPHTHPAHTHPAHTGPAHTLHTQAPTHTLNTQTPHKDPTLTLHAQTPHTPCTHSPCTHRPHTQPAHTGPVHALLAHPLCSPHSTPASTVSHPGLDGEAPSRGCP